MLLQNARSCAGNRFSRSNALLPYALLWQPSLKARGAGDDDAEP
jgi:hypothetical protein